MRICAQESKTMILLGAERFCPTGDGSSGEKKRRRKKGKKRRKKKKKTEMKKKKKKKMCQDSFSPVRNAVFNVVTFVVCVYCTARISRVCNHCHAVYDTSVA